MPGEQQRDGIAGIVRKSAKSAQDSRLRSAVWSRKPRADARFPLTHMFFPGRPRLPECTRSTSISECYTFLQDGSIGACSAFFPHPWPCRNRARLIFTAFSGYTWTRRVDSYVKLHGAKPACQLRFAPGPFGRCPCEIKPGRPAWPQALAPGLTAVGRLPQLPSGGSFRL
jgi:hypothetical protein